MGDTIWYQEALEARAEHCHKVMEWQKIPQPMLDWLTEYVAEIYESHPLREVPSPMTVIDNFIVNGTWGWVEDAAKDDDQTPEEWLEANEGDCTWVSPDRTMFVINCG